MHSRQPVEVESLETFDSLVAQGARSMKDWRLQDLDLTGRSSALRSLNPRGSVFLGGRLTADDERSLRDRGALIFPALPDVPFDPYRARLYTPEELYDGLEGGYADTPDARIYAWNERAHGFDDTLASALHDHSVDDALAEYAAGRRVVGVMGGHSLSRNTQAYADSAALGRVLAATGLTVATGGGPGAMEAVNLGASSADLSEDELARLVTLLASVPDFEPDITTWARVGLSVRAELPRQQGRSLGIPTWHYGHEPPNLFPDAVAKFFRNSLREDVLINLSTAGIVVLPGAAGTVEEIFTDASAAYYSPAPAPMVLVGREFWTDQLPAWPLLSALGQGRPMGSALHLADTAEEVLAALAQSDAGGVTSR